MRQFLTDMPDKWHKTLIREWHPTLNGDLEPSDVTVGSNKKVWWRCQEGHEWQASIRSRIKGAGCPYDSVRLPIPGVTDLATANPVLANEWHPSLNGNLKPTDVTKNSNKKVWWRCRYGHEWQDSIKNRSNGCGCPYDMRKRIPSVAEKPTLAAEWHPTLNSNLKPSEVDIYSNKLVWWKCKEGHEWQATVQSRINGSRCPYDV